MDIKRLTGLDAKDPAELKEITRRLCYFAAKGSQDYVNELVEFLALSTLSKLPPGSHSAKEIYNRLSELVNFKFEYEQLLAALRRLEANKNVFVVNSISDENARFGLDVAQISELTKAYKAQIDFEKKVIDSWRCELKSRYPDLTDEGLEALADDLEAFSLRLFSIHSIESVSLYFGEDSKTIDLLKRMDVQTIRDILPERDPKLHSIRMQELPRFFLNAPLDRKKYIGQQLNQIFILHMLQLDPTCARLAVMEIKGGTMFLDTNFVIRLLGIDGPDLQNAAQRLICLSQRLGYRTVVSPRTLEEYHAKINYFIRRTKSLPQLPPEVAEAALSVAVGEDFLSRYWQRSLDPRGASSLTGYYELYQQVEVLLEQYSVCVDDTGDKAIRADTKALATEEAQILNALPDYQGHPSVLEHDAHHRLLILRLRGGHEEKSPLEVPYWFLTCDTKLPVYDRRSRPRLKLRYPFCVLSSHWMQLLRPFATAVEELEVSQATNLDSPLFRLFRIPPKELIQDIISRLEAHENIPPKITARIIMNTAFVLSFDEEQDESKRDGMLHDLVLNEIAEMLEEDRRKLTEEKTQLTNRLDKLEKEHAERPELERRLEQLTTNLSEVDEKLRSASQGQRQAILEKELQGKRIEELNRQVETLNRQASQRNASQIEAVDKLTKALEDERKDRDDVVGKLKDDLERQRLGSVRQQKTLLIILAWIASGTFLLATSPWSRTDNARWLTLIIVVVAMIITQLVALWQSKPAKWIIIILIGVDVITLVAGTILLLGITPSDNIIFNSIIISMAILQGIGALYSILEHHKVSP